MENDELMRQSEQHRQAAERYANLGMIEKAQLHELRADELEFGMWWKNTTQEQKDELKRKRQHDIEKQWLRKNKQMMTGDENSEFVNTRKRIRHFAKQRNSESAKKTVKESYDAITQLYNKVKMRKEQHDQSVQRDKQKKEKFLIDLKNRKDDSNLRRVAIEQRLKRKVTDNELPELERRYKKEKEKEINLRKKLEKVNLNLLKDLDLSTRQGREQARDVLRLHRQPTVNFVN